MPASLVVRVNRDLLLLPLVVPEVQRDDVGKQLEIGDRQVLEMRGRGGGEKLVRVVVVTTQPWCLIFPSVR